MAGSNVAYPIVVFSLAMTTVFLSDRWTSIGLISELISREYA